MDSGEQVMTAEEEVSAYKLNKNKCSYNQIEIRFFNPLFPESKIGLIEAIEDKLNVDVAQELCESVLKYNVTLENGCSLQLYVWVVYGESINDNWHPVLREHCCKGCKGSILRSPRRYGKLGKRNGGLEEKSSDGNKKEKKHLFIGIDEASTHVTRHCDTKSSCFRLLINAWSGGRMLGQSTSCLIRVRSNNDVPKGAAYMNITVPLREEWWNTLPGKSLHGQCGQESSSYLNKIINVGQADDMHSISLKSFVSEFEGDGEIHGDNKICLVADSLKKPRLELQSTSRQDSIMTHSLGGAATPILLRGEVLKNNMSSFDHSISHVVNSTTKQTGELASPSLSSFMPCLISPWGSSGMPIHSPLSGAGTNSGFPRIYSSPSFSGSGMGNRGSANYNVGLTNSIDVCNKLYSGMFDTDSLTQALGLSPMITPNVISDNVAGMSGYGMQGRTRSRLREPESPGNFFIPSDASDEFKAVPLSSVNRKYVGLLNNAFVPNKHISSTERENYMKSQISDVHHLSFFESQDDADKTLQPKSDSQTAIKNNENNIFQNKGESAEGQKLPSTMSVIYSPERQSSDTCRFYDFNLWAGQQRKMDVQVLGEKKINTH